MSDQQHTHIPAQVHRQDKDLVDRLEILAFAVCIWTPVQVRRDKIVEAHGSMLEVQSVEGHGSTFKFPLLVAAEAKQ